MLLSLLFSQPFSKFVLIEDSVERGGFAIIDTIIEHHIKLSTTKIHIACLERWSTSQADSMQIVYHNLRAVGTRTWCDEIDETIHDVVARIQNGTHNTILIVDSLNILVYADGLGKTFELFSELTKEAKILQIVVVLHCDISYDYERISQTFQYISTIHIMFNIWKNDTTKPRVKYTFRNSNGKLLRKNALLWYDGDQLQSKNVAEPVELGDQVFIDTLADYDIEYIPVNPESLDSVTVTDDGELPSPPRTHSEPCIPTTPKEKVPQPSRSEPTFKTVDKDQPSTSSSYISEFNISTNSVDDDNPIRLEAQILYVADFGDDDLSDEYDDDLDF